LDEAHWWADIDATTAQYLQDAPPGCFIYPGGYSLVRDYLAPAPRHSRHPRPGTAAAEGQDGDQLDMSNPRNPELAALQAHVQPSPSSSPNAAAANSRNGAILPAASQNCAPSSPGCAATRTPSPPG
jgi:hypothetical protein